jgi:hypothetical protein
LAGPDVALDGGCSGNFIAMGGQTGYGFFEYVQKNPLYQLVTDRDCKAQSCFNDKQLKLFD